MNAAASSHLARLGLGLATVLALAGPAAALQPDEVLRDPALEARARRISSELRCLVCQNQSIDDSDAPLAHDLRVLVRARLTEGDSDAQVRDFVVSRYGDFVLLRPPMTAQTALLWFGPALVLAGAAAGLFLARRPGRRDKLQPLTEDEERRLAALTAGTAQPASRMRDETI